MLRLFRSPTPWLLILLSAAAYGLFVWVEAIGGPDEINARYGRLAPAISGSAQVVLSLTPFPSDIFAIARGALYGFWIAAPLNWFAWWIAASLEFGLGRRASEDFDLEHELRRLPSWLRNFPVGHPAFLILGRLVPWAGGHITTFVPGAMGVSFRRHLWCSAIAILPSALGLAALGAGLLSAM